MNSPQLVIVTGSGRSGTSTAAGTLKRLGLHVPQPELPPTDINPRGFFEPQWVVDFHERMLDELPARTNDARPGVAADLRRVATTSGATEELTGWLAEQVREVGDGGQVLVKDPRIIWFHETWKAAAAAVGAELGFLTMLRHPVEVAQSRALHFQQGQSDDFRRIRQATNIAGWVNGAFETDLATRGHPRVFVRYADLTADWRSALAPVRDRLGLSFDADLASSEHHAVDDFIDTTLHRARVAWDDTETLPALRELAQTCWEALNALVDDPDDAAATAALEQARPPYVALHDYAEGIAFDHTQHAVVTERRRVRARLREKHAQRVGRLRGKLREARGAS